MHNPTSWHIEPTSRCTLECPGCDRTWFKKTFGHQIIQDIDVDALENFFVTNNFTKSQIRLCGNNGDPIYHRNFIKLITVLKSQDHAVRIHTNGSAKTPKFWQEVCDCLDDKDQVVFAIDGLEDTNSNYRKNANWQQIMDAVQTCVKQHIDTEWQFIVFKYNQHQIDDARKMSVQLGMNNFRIHKSHRWLDESLNNFMPDKEHIDQDYDNRVATVESNIERTMVPMCGMNRETFIDSKGDIYPCCWTGAYRFQRKHIFGTKPINISCGEYILPQLHQDFVNSTNKWSTAPLVCRLQCSK